MRYRALLLLALITVPSMVQGDQATRAVTDRFVDLTFDLEYDALGELYAPDAVFEDPTADVFQGPLAQGPIEGADAIIAIQKSWGLAEADYDVHAAFTAGQYSLYRGSLTVGYAARDQQPARSFTMPFLTILRVEQGKITERLDFGEYIKSFNLGDRFDPTTRSTREVADRYRDAYLNGDLDTQRRLMADTIVFQDPTARIFGEVEGASIKGAEPLITRRRPMYEAVESFELDVADSFYANHHAVYMGTVHYALKTGMRFAQPAVLALEVKDGKITRHWDFVDYSVPPLETAEAEASR